MPEELAPDMELLREQARKLKTEWGGVYEGLRDNPTVYQAHLQHATLQQLGEVVSTIVYWIDRVRAPRGFAPTFHIARSLAATALGTALQAVSSIARAEYGFFPNLIVSLNQMASSLHSMLAFSDRAEARDAVATLGGKLAESLSLLDTAQTELAAKSELLTKGTALIEELTDAVATVEGIRSRADASIAEISVSEQSAREKANEIKTHAATADELGKRSKALLEESENLHTMLEEQQEALAEMKEKLVEQQKLIADLLPKGASAGLASAFALRVAQLERTKWMFIACFALAVIVLTVVGALASAQVSNLSGPEIWHYLLRRLPIAGPLIWLAWFSAVQYGNTLRVQEDYAFKEATSKAFAGYRDHLEHLASVSLKDGNSAMTLLAASTIEILAREPLRVFGHTHKDATPAQSFMGMWRSKTDKKD